MRKACHTVVLIIHERELAVLRTYAAHAPHNRTIGTTNLDDFIKMST